MNPMSMAVLDSFLVQNGRMLVPNLHRERTSSAAKQLWGSKIPEFLIELAVDALYSQAVTEIKQQMALGEAAPQLLFPLLKLEGPDYPGAKEPSQKKFSSTALQYSVEIRPWEVDRLRAHAALWVPEKPDQRRFAQVKGPDFDYLLHLRAQAVNAGADEAILLDGNGKVLEGGFGSLVCFHEGTLLVNSNPQRLMSTTELALINYADSQKWPVKAVDFNLDTLFQADAVWLLSALHTVQTVTQLKGEKLVVKAAPSGREIRQKLWEQSADFSELAA